MKEQDGKFDREVDRLSAVLQAESESAFDLVEEVMKNLNKSNLISFITIMLYDEISNKRITDGWKRDDAQFVFDCLYQIGIIESEDIKKSIESASEITIFLFISALERIAENLESFTQNAIRAFWQTENNVCSNCGTEQSSESLYCKQCGEKMENNSWDKKIRQVTTDISKELMAKVKHRYYYIDLTHDDAIKGTFFKNNLSKKDIKYLTGSLKSLDLKVIDANDRIHFEKIGKINNKLNIVENIDSIAKSLKFQKKNICF